MNVNIKLSISIFIKYIYKLQKKDNNITLFNDTNFDIHKIYIKC